MPARVSSRYSGFLLQYKDMQVRLLGGHSQGVSAKEHACSVSQPCQSLLWPALSYWCISYATIGHLSLSVKGTLVIQSVLPLPVVWYGSYWLSVWYLLCMCQGTAVTKEAWLAITNWETSKMEKRIVPKETASERSAAPINNLSTTQPNINLCYINKNKNKNVLF